MKATEKHKKQMKEWNKTHRENLKIAQKKYYETHKDYFKKFNRINFKDMQQEIDRLNNIINKAISKVNSYELIKGYYDYIEDGYAETGCNNELQDDLLNILRGDKE